MAFAILILIGVSSAAAQNPKDDVSSITDALRSQQYDQAFQMAQASLQKTPNDPRILTLKGLALSGLGKKKEALAGFNAALKI
ncbi:MAG: hypothetical protein WCD27_14645, partial [Candidatus Acidiferrales bacterium]